MAYASKQFNGASYGVRGEYVLVEQIEKDISNNRSKLKVTFCVYGTSSSASLAYMLSTTGLIKIYSMIYSSLLLFRKLLYYN